MARILSLVLVLSLSSVAACSPSIGVVNWRINPESPRTCSNMCAEIGLVMDGLNVAAGRVECLCRVAQPATAAFSASCSEPPPPSPAP